MVLLTMIDYPTESIEEVGQFELFQVTYDLLRGWSGGEDQEIAHFDGEKWKYEGKRYSDFTIVSIEEKDNA